MNIDEMQAGRELDGLIAEKILALPGFAKGCSSKYCGIIGYAHPQVDGEYYYKRPGWLSDLIPAYSAEIAAAWQVVKKAELLTVTDTYLPALHRENNLWIFSSICFSDWETITSADTAPLAICRAALKAVMK